PLILLGYLNSSIVKFYMKECYGSLGMDGGINYSPKNVGEIPFPVFTAGDSGIVIRCVKSIIKCIEDNDNQWTLECDGLSSQIDEVIYHSYGMNHSQIASVVKKVNSGIKRNRKKL